MKVLSVTVAATALVASVQGLDEEEEQCIKDFLNFDMETVDACKTPEAVAAQETFTSLDFPCNDNVTQWLDTTSKAVEDFKPCVAAAEAKLSNCEQGAWFQSHLQESLCANRGLLNTTTDSGFCFSDCLRNAFSFVEYGEESAASSIGTSTLVSGAVLAALAVKLF